jgi:hypothetical protein
VVDDELKPLLHSARHRLILAISYRVDPSDVPGFRAAMAAVRLARYRDGAVGWALSRDVGDIGSWVETFRFRNWHELQRGIARINQADSDGVLQARELHRGTEPPRLTLLMRE